MVYFSILSIIILLILAGCAGPTPKLTYNEKDDLTANYSDGEVVQRINDIKMGATPKEKPTGKAGSNDQTQSQMPPAGETNNMQLANLAKDYKSAILKTNLGDIKVGFYASESPLTVNNFLNLAQKGFYNNTKFHRVINDFMIQGGDPLSIDADPANDGTGGPGYKFQDEINEHKLVKGSLAMANSGPNTNGSQFFIVTKEATPWLDGKHTNFGYVVEGMEIVDKIGLVETGLNDRPISDVILDSIELIK